MTALATPFSLTILLLALLLITYNTFPHPISIPPNSTEKWYLRLATAEQTLARLGLLGGYSRGKDEQTYYRLRSSGSFIEDDHIPFLRRSELPFVFWWSVLFCYSS